MKAKYFKASIVLLALTTFRTACRILDICEAALTNTRLEDFLLPQPAYSGQNVAVYQCVTLIPKFYPQEINAARIKSRLALNAEES